MNKIKLPSALVVLLICGPWHLYAQAPIIAEFDSNAEVEEFKIFPAKEPRQINIHFEGRIYKDSPGNAAVSYYQALLLFTQNNDSGDKASDNLDKVSNWIQQSPGEVDWDEVEKHLAPYGACMRELFRGTKMTECDWNLPLKEQGFQTLLPHLSSIRNLGRLLILQSKLDFFRGNMQGALDSTGAGFRLAQHIAQGDTLIEGLVAIAVLHQTIQSLETLIQSPECPNLYWSLTQLPSPLLDIRDSMRYEMLAELLFDSTDLQKGPKKFSTDAWRKLVDKFYSLMGDAGRDEFSRDWLSTGVGIVNYPHAKRLLLDVGFTQNEVDSMPVSEALIRQAWEEITHTRDERMKWYGLPYWQNYKALGELDEGNEFLEKADLFSIINRMLIPALSKAQQKFVMLDQKIVMLRAIEACRMQLAMTPDQPLSEWPDVAVHFASPIDPGTGSPILIRSAGDFTELQTYLPVYDEAPKTRLISLKRGSQTDEE
jgi:hypothetical protein